MSEGEEGEERLASRVFKLAPGYKNYDGLAMVIHQSKKMAIAMFLASTLGLLCMLFWVVKWAAQFERFKNGTTTILRFGNSSSTFSDPFPEGQTFIALCMLIIIVILSLASIMGLMRIHRCIDSLIVQSKETLARVESTTTTTTTKKESPPPPPSSPQPQQVRFEGGEAFVDVPIPTSSVKKSPTTTRNRKNNRKSLKK